MELLLLDIKGVLCQEVTEKPNQPYIKLKNYYIILRPGLTEFLKYCYDHYTVGFFTSTTKKNANLILDRILTQEQFKLVHINWSRSRTRYEPTEKHGYKTIKVLKDLFDNPEYNHNRNWSESNVILVDDSIDKVRFNKPENILIAPSFDPTKQDTVLVDLMEQITAKFAKLRNRS